MILILSFLVWLMIMIGTPLAIRGYILNNTRPLKIYLQPRSGTITQQITGQTTPQAIEGITDIRSKSSIILSDDADALLLFYHPGQLETPLITAQIYGATEIAIDSARTPRFLISQLPHQVRLMIKYGSNTRISVEDGKRPSELKIQTPHGEVSMETGSYIVTVEKKLTDFSVRTGRAHIPDPVTAEIYTLNELQHTELSAAGLGPIYGGDERNILRNRNGDFSEPLENNWEIFEDRAFEAEPRGEVRSTTLGDERHIVLFSRGGLQHSEIGIRQTVEQDIRGAKSLHIRARIKIDIQTLGVCGTLGTECPIMIRVYYTDQEGAIQEWLHGFYAKEDAQNNYQAFCQVCHWKTEHQKIPQSVWYDYESADLLAELEEQGVTPTIIQSIEVYASGHAYGSAIENIEILIKE